MIMSLLGQGNTSFSLKDSTLIQVLKISENKEFEMEKRSATCSPNSPSHNLIKSARNPSPVERHFFLPLKELSKSLRRWWATVMCGPINLSSATKTAKLGYSV